MFDLIYLIFATIPIGTVVFFIISLIRFCTAKRRNRLMPGSISRGEMITRMVLFIASAATVVVVFAVIIGFIAVMSMSITSM